MTHGTCSCRKGGRKGKKPWRGVGGGGGECYNNLCPESQSGAKLPTREHWLQDPSKWDERHAGAVPSAVHPSPTCHCVQGLTPVHHGGPRTQEAVLLESLFEGICLGKTDYERPPLHFLVLPLTISSPSLVFYSPNYGPEL